MAALEIIALDTATPQLRAPASGDTYTAPRAMDITPVALTGSAATSSLSIAQTWNTTGTPTAIDLNVTDTASNAASLLMDLRVGGTSRFRVAKNSRTTASSWEIDAGYFSGFSSVAAAMARTTAQRNLIMECAGNAGTGVYLPSYAGYFFTASAVGTDVGITSDLALRRDAANTLAQRNGTNAQAFNIYNTYTDASNYERGFVRYSGNVLQIGHEAAGTGVVNRLIRISSSTSTIADFTNAAGTITAARIGVDVSAFKTTVGLGSGGASPTAFVYWREAGVLAFTSNAGGTTGAASEYLEQTAPAAPAADRVRIFAQDNGAGKTQLMALFATGAAQVIAVEP